MSSTSAEDFEFSYPVAPDGTCDVVMKGGITSGVVYPLALCRLAERFRLQNIGGTSAGAIAAAAAAASEYGRRHQTGEGYRALEGLPCWLGCRDTGASDSHLFNLFQPTADTRGLFALLVAAISHPKQTVAFEILLSAAANWKLRSALAALPGLGLFALLFLAIAQSGNVAELGAMVVGLLGALAVALVGVVAMLGFTLYRQAPRELANNYFGICRGVRAEGSPATSEPLTEWLHGLIQRASGAKDVLTFGDLWNGTEGPREIDLAMVTTCLTLGRPYRLPFALNDGFFFDPSELRDLFPEPVVARLIAGSGTKEEGREGYLALPRPESLPVVFAARLSLSFPFLLSTVPLYQLTLRENGEQSFLRCHFSDGGICSNFPISFFDSPLPRWPTFGINLAGPIVGGVEVWMPKTNRDPTPPPTRQVDSVGAFVAGIRGAAQNWHDNAYVDMPGFRDRIAQIRFAVGEGGLNLNMPEELIRNMSRRGELAGRKLVSRFSMGVEPDGEAIELTWNNHRRIRQRVAFAALEDFSMQMLVGYTGDEQLIGAPRRFGASTPMWDEQTYEQLLTSAAPYAGMDSQQRQVAQTIASIAEVLATAWALVRGRDLPPRESPAMSFDEPRPAMQASIAPPL